MRNKITKYIHWYFIKNLYLFKNGFTFKCILLIKVFYSTLSRTSVSILVIPNSPEVGWRKRDSNVNYSIDDIMVTATETAATAMLFIRMSRESQKDWNCSQIWLGDLYKRVKKHRSFFTVISVTKHSFRLDFWSPRITDKLFIV